MVGPALIAVTAIVAAWIASRTANRRQQQQLVHDREVQRAQLLRNRGLQEAQLSHDGVLQKAQLAYDREQRNRQLDLRLGGEHPICKNHTVYVNAYSAAFEILHDLPTAKMTEGDHKTVKEADVVETAAVVGFLSSCRTWFEDEQRRVAQEPPTRIC